MNTSEKPGGESPGGKGFAWRRLIPLFILLAALAFAVSMGWHQYLTLAALRDHQAELRALVAQHGVMAGIAFTVIYAIVIAISIPGGLILTLCGGFLFGAIAGMLYVVVGATLGATGVFLAARTALGDAFRRRAGPFLQKMEEGFRENEMSYMLVLRLIPLFPFWLVNIVPAILGVSLRNYVIGTFIGIIPATFVFASVGAGLSSLLETFDPEDPPNLASIILEPRYILPIAGLVVLSVLPIVYKKLKSRKQGEAS